MFPPLCIPCQTKITLNPIRIVPEILCRYLNTLDRIASKSYWLSTLNRSDSCFLKRSKKLRSLAGYEGAAAALGLGMLIGYKVV